MTTEYIKIVDVAAPKPEGFKANWSGTYPTRCFGTWSLTYDGVPLEIPAEQQGGPMNTYREYSSWYFTEDWDEETEYYEHGLTEEDWIAANLDWVKPMLETAGIAPDPDTLTELYEAINAEDWQHNSCGGCI